MAETPPATAPTAGAPPVIVADASSSPSTELPPVSGGATTADAHGPLSLPPADGGDPPQPALPQAAASAEGTAPAPAQEPQVAARTPPLVMAERGDADEEAIMVTGSRITRQDNLVEDRAAISVTGVEVDDLRTRVEISPPAVAQFIRRRADCNHFLGEEPYDRDRAAELQRAIRELRCAEIDRDERALRRAFRRDRTVLELLTATEDLLGL